jgi:HEAT repeats/NACHT domain
MRDDFSAKTIETLAKRVGCRCSNPGCRKLTTGPHEEAHKSVNIGVAAHITAAAPGGKRYDASLLSEARKSIENGMWLCQNCGKLIDSDEQKYSVDLLRSWKREAERQAQSEVEQSTSGSSSSESTRFKSYLESVVAYYQDWWKDCYKFMNAINEQPWSEFPLNCTTRAKSQNSGSQSKDPLPDLPPQLVLDAIHDYASEKILIVGAPGAGKSTLLAQVLRIAAEKAKKDPNAPIPVLIALRDVKATGDSASIPALVMRSLKSHDYSLNDGALTSLLTGTGRRLLLLVDGLNEKPDAKSDLMQFCRNISLIATGRNDGDGWEIERKLELQPPSKSEVTKFFQERLPNANRAQLKVLGDRVQDFGQTPLMVWMLYSIFQTTGSTPATRGEAYRAFTTLYTERAKEGVDLTDSRILLGKLAFEMMRSPNPDDPTDFRLKVSEIKAQSILGSEANLKRMLNHLIRQQGTPGNREISFCHQSLQEYYAAEALLERLPGLSDAELQREYLNYLKWTEPVALMLAIVQDEILVVRLVENAFALDLILGMQLAGEVKREFQPQTVRVMDRLEVPSWLKGKVYRSSALPKFNLFPPGYVLPIDPETSIQVLLERVLSPTSDCDDIWSAAERLGDIGSGSALPVLLERMADSNSDVRWRAVYALGIIGCNLAIPHLLKLLEDPDFDVRWFAIGALGDIGSDLALSALIEFVVNSDSNIRAQTAETLGKIASEKAIPALFKLLADSDLRVREQTAEALGKIGSETAISGLLQLLEDVDSDVSMIAAGAFSKIAKRKKGAIAHYLPQLLTLIPTDSGQAAHYVILAIQANCKYHNYDIFCSPPA